MRDLDIDMKPRRALASRLRQARKDAGLTQARAAKLLGWTRSTISDFETCRSEPSLDQLSTLARLYGVDVHWLTELVDTETDAAPAPLEPDPRELARLQEQELDRAVALSRSRYGGG